MKNPTRIGFYEKLAAMGVSVKWEIPDQSTKYLGETIADLRISRKSNNALKPVEVRSFEVSSLIDEIPALAVVASFADGSSRFEGLAELRVKESDRLAQIIDLLTSCGVRCSSGADWLQIDGNGDQAVNAFSFSSEDHRMVMASMILSTRGRGPSKIGGLTWIRTSFPLFLEAFQNINSYTK